MAKLIIFSAPSGTGKSTVIEYLLKKNLDLEFSISATSRSPRGTEQHGIEYYFLTVDDFKYKIAHHEFLEYEEVYKDRFYGTLKSEVDRLLHENKNVIFDVDVIGGCNIKKIYGDKALSIFLSPPSVEELSRRLHKRGTDSEEVIKMRLSKANEEMSYANKFDLVIINNNLEIAQKEAFDAIQKFLAK